MESCRKMLDIFLSVFNTFQRTLIVYIKSFSVLTQINFMDLALNIYQATVRELLNVCKKTTGPLCCTHSEPNLFWLWCHELKDYLRKINICFNGCLLSHLKQTKPHPEKKNGFRIKKWTDSGSHLLYWLLNSQSRQKPQQLVFRYYNPKNIY